MMLAPAPFGALPIEHPPIVAMCTECRRVDSGQETEPGARPRRFAAWCSSCNEPTEIVALVPFRMTVVDDDEWWSAAALDEEEVRRARETSSQMANVRCLTCGELHLGYEAGAGDSCSETHLPAWCSCGGSTEAIIVEPAGVSLDHEDGSEFYVVILEHDELEAIRQGVDPFHDGWRS
jgi:hypothetical protein